MVLSIWNEGVVVRSFETDFMQRWKPACFFQAMQEAATHHAASFGFGYQDMLARDSIWVLSRMKIYFYRFPTVEEQVNIETWPKGIQQRLFFMRDFHFTDAHGERLASATSAWILISPSARKILPPHALNGTVPDNQGRNAIDERLDKLDLPAEMSETLRVKAGYSAVDLMGHVNNARYVEWVCDAFDLEEYRERQLEWMQINYVNEVKAGEEVSIQMSQGGEGVWSVQGMNLSTAQKAFEAALKFRG